MFSKNGIFKIIFLGLLLFIIYYISFIKTEKYTSSSIIMIKDLSKEQTSSPLGALLFSGASSSSMTDAMLLEVYINSSDMFENLDNEFNLTAYYGSEKLDFFNRLFNDTFAYSYLLNFDNILIKYMEDLEIIYDEASSTLEISFSHANPKVAQKIVERILVFSEERLNFFEKKSSEVVLSFLKEQEMKKYNRFMDSIKGLLFYQNKHNTIDPKIDIESKSSILAGLESELVQKNVEYNSKSKYLNKSAVEMKLLKGNIEFLKKSIDEIRMKITGSNKKNKLNVNMSDFTLLKSRVEFDKRLYIQTLIKLEETKVLVTQNRKNILIVNAARVAENYTYPNKIKDSFSMFIIFSFLYGIISLILTIIRDHKD